MDDILQIEESTQHPEVEVRGVDRDGHGEGRGGAGAGGVPPHSLPHPRLGFPVPAPVRKLGMGTSPLLAQWGPHSHLNNSFFLKKSITNA